MNQHSQATQAVNLFSIIFPVQEIFLFLQTNDFPFNLMPIRLPAALLLSMVMVKLISAAVKFFSYLTGHCVRMWDNEPLIMRIELTVMTMMKIVMVTMTMKSVLRSLRTGAAMCAHGKGRDEGP